MSEQRHYLTIRQISEQLKIPKPTLRFWEKELDGIIAPHRTRGGQRRYTIENLKLIEQIINFRNEGMSLAQIKRRLGNDIIDQNQIGYCDNINVLADKIAAAVRSEVYNFFKTKLDKRK